MLKIDFNNILDTSLGQTHGISELELNNAIAANSYICQQVQAERQEGKHAFLDLPYHNVDDIVAFARKKAKAPK